MASIGRTLYQLGFEISPIILVNGIASLIPGQMLPIVALTQAADFTLGLLSGSINTDLDQFLCHWKPLPGTTLIENQVGEYPFANQNIAANAMIAQPLHVSMLMVCPVQTEGGYAAKLVALTVLQQTLQQHIAAGGTFTVATPSGIFTNCLLIRVSDVSSGEIKQPQHTWQFDFVQPLITINQATQVWNSLMQKIGGGLPTGLTPSWTGPGSTTGANLAVGAGATIPAVTGLVGTTASGVLGSVGNSAFNGL
jgi:hypothetical protein